MRRPTLLPGSGVAIPLFSPFASWVGVLQSVLGTTLNALFYPLQNATAHQLYVSNTLVVAANTTGGVTTKMISSRSLARQPA